MSAGGVGENVANYLLIAERARGLIAEMGEDRAFAHMRDTYIAATLADPNGLRQQASFMAWVIMADVTGVLPDVTGQPTPPPAPPVPPRRRAPWRYVTGNPLAVAGVTSAGCVIVGILWGAYSALMIGMWAGLYVLALVTAELGASVVKRWARRRRGGRRVPGDPQVTP